jgi:hypothetical protein
VSEVPDPLRRLHVLFEAIRIAHETIYDLHRRLVNADRATPLSQGLLAESARIVLRSAPDASAGSHRLAATWHEQSVLDPDAAEDTALKLDTELAHAESVLRELLARESAIAAELRALATERG